MQIGKINVTYSLLVVTFVVQLSMWKQRFVFTLTTVQRTLQLTQRFVFTNRCVSCNVRCTVVNVKTNRCASCNVRCTVVNVKTNRCARVLGKGENARFLQVSLFQGTANRPKAAVTMDMEASDNPILKGIKFDPILFCTAIKKNRFYMFTTREPDDTKR